MIDFMILAAGLGTRMKSNRAKVLHQLAGRPLIAHVMRAACGINPRALITIVGHQAKEVEQAVRDEITLSTTRMQTPPELHFALQTEQRGTGHAAMSARDVLSGRQGAVIVTAGDVPLMQVTMLRQLAETHMAEQNAATVVTVTMDDPTSYGRIIREQGRFARIVEQKDGTPEELAVKEVCVSVYCFDIVALLDAFDHLTNDNAQSEYYLTDVPAIMLARGNRVGIFHHNCAEELVGINTRIELAEVEKQLREKKLRELMLAGVTILDPATTYVHQDVDIAPDTTLYPQVIIEGASRIGSNCEVQSWTRLRNVTIGDHVTVKNSCVIEDSVLHDHTSIGPFARLRMQAEIGEQAAIGNFVEVKKSKIGRETKASHLTYLGDATLGERVNIGAGTVTCNYDGVRKNETFIEDEVKIGSDTMLVAPVRVGRGAVTGAGSVVTEDIPADSLVVGVPAKVKKKLK